MRARWSFARDRAPPGRSAAPPSPRVLEVVQNITGIQPGETDPELKFSLETVNCLGCCALGPVMEIDEQHLGKLAPALAADLLKNYD